MASICDENTLDSDSIIQVKDTAHVYGLPKEYQVIKKQTSKNRWTRKLFSMIFRESSPPDTKKQNRAIVEDYKPFEGKIIRNININVLPPFGTNINNPSERGDEFKILNSAHASTREATIKNIIQFRQNTPVNAATVATSESQLRNTGYIYDARIFIEPMAHTEDSVDVNIIVRDKWTIGLNLHSLSSSKVNLEIFDRNVLGTGSRVGFDFIYSNKYDRKYGFGGNYVYQNFAKKNIDLSGSYVDRIKEYETEFAATRNLQPKLNYFGEISYKRRFLHPERIEWDSVTPDRNQQFSITAGRAFTLSKENAIRRVVVGLRYKMKIPEYKNTVYNDYMQTNLAPYKYTKNQMLLMQLSLYQNSYLREHMVYNFGNTEDIPQGYNLSMQLGYSHFSKIKDAMYGSLSASYGSSKIMKGNLYVKSEISSFFGNGKPFGGVFNFDSRYFTPLFRWSGLRFRQFFTLNYSKILHADRYFGDKIYMGQHTTLPIKNWRDSKSGYEQLLFKSETDLFSNYEILGFRFLFYTFFDMGWIKSKGNLFNSDNINYGAGLGIRLRNNFIIFNTIDLKIGYYPKLEQSGFNSFFKINSSTPDIAPDFAPSIPEEIMLE
ncbi:POTRA domain-containing protein [Dysgonomonas sp. 520]|uniref:POTRA domain-containing protein n=1 Tax=Dysgonomonas sp. 520 TaxID=2302931 RepID=UPI0013D54E49|nr:POTRA domain-containing protein [Dysgonomonas sp. 520]